MRVLAKDIVYRYELLKDNKNADKLFKAFLDYCEKNIIDPESFFTIEDIANAIPRGTSGVTNYATYGFSLMSMFSNQKSRDYFVFEDPHMTKIFTETCNNNYNRDNYLWRKMYLKVSCHINPMYFTR